MRLDAGCLINCCQRARLPAAVRRAARAARAGAMAATLKEAAAAIGSYAKAVRKQRKSALGVDEGAALLERVSCAGAAASLPALRAALAELHGQLTRAGVLSLEALVRDWHARCACAADGGALSALCDELDEATDWTVDAPWHRGGAHAAGGGGGAGASAAPPDVCVIPLSPPSSPPRPAPRAADDDAGAAVELRLARRDAEVARLQARNAALEAQVAALQDELRKLRPFSSRAGSASAAAALPPLVDADDAEDETIDLCDSDEDDDDEDDDIVDLTCVEEVLPQAPPLSARAPPPPRKLEGDTSGAAGAAAAAAAAPRFAPAVAKRDAPPAPALPARAAFAPSPKQLRPRKKRALGGGAADADADADAAAPRGGRGQLLSLLSALLHGRGQLAAARAAAAVAPLHTLGEHHGVTVLHAAACSDASAAVLAAVLASAAADGPDALAYALRRQSGADTHRSAFGSVRRRPGSDGSDGGSLVRAAPPCLDVGATALDFAALHGAVECAALLVAAGADVRGRTARLRNLTSRAAPLDLAAACGHTGVLRLLLRARADVNARCEPERWCALHWAAEYARTDAVRLLLLHGARPDAADSLGRTAADWALASENGHPRGGSSASHALAADCHDERVSVLVELAHAGATAGLPLRPDAPIEGRTGYGRSLLHACAGGLTASSLPLLRRLLSGGAHGGVDADAGAGAEGSPLDLAVHAGWAEGALLLLNKGADANSRDKTGSTPLMRAASLRPGLGGSDLLRLCVAKGADVHASDANGRTAAHYACEYGCADALRTLRALGADLNRRDAHGHAPLDVAAAHHAGRALLSLRFVAAAPMCPPRTMLPGEDAACDLEEVAITVDDGVVLPEDMCFITSNVEAQRLTLCVTSPGDDVAGGAGAAAAARCCECTLCVPGLCPCLSRARAVVDAAAELEAAAPDAAAAAAAARELCKEPPPSASGAGAEWRAISALLRSAAALATALHIAETAPSSLPSASSPAAAAASASSAPDVHPKHRAVALAAALLALRHALPLPSAAAGAAGGAEDAAGGSGGGGGGLELDAGWEQRVRHAVSKCDESRACARLAELLLELDDAAAAALAALVAAAASTRAVPVWRARQAAAWLAEARPCWRASVRQGRAAAPPTPSALADAMRTLQLSLRSISSPLRIVTASSSSSSSAAGVARVQLCAPRCPCAGGGCRAVGVQFPLAIRAAGARAGLGAFAACDIPAGALVAPYIGEVTTASEANTRAADSAAASADFYRLDLECKPWLHLKKQLGGEYAVLDAARFGNVARFFNHGCVPNLARAAVEWPGQEAGALVFLYAQKDICAGTELTWDYFSGCRGAMGFQCACPACVAAVRPPGAGRGKQRVLVD
jgi:ankyrin repeat protein